MGAGYARQQCISQPDAHSSKRLESPGPARRNSGFFNGSGGYRPGLAPAPLAFWSDHRQQLEQQPLPESQRRSPAAPTAGLARAPHGTGNKTLRQQRQQSPSPADLRLAGGPRGLAPTL